MLDKVKGQESYESSAWVKSQEDETMRSNIQDYITDCWKEVHNALDNRKRTCSSVAKGGMCDDETHQCWNTGSYKDTCVTSNKLTISSDIFDILDGCAVATNATKQLKVIIDHKASLQYLE